MSLVFLFSLIRLLIADYGRKHWPRKTKTPTHLQHILFSSYSRIRFQCVFKIQIKFCKLRLHKKCRVCGQFGRTKIADTLYWNSVKLKCITTWGRECCFFGPSNWHASFVQIIKKVVYIVSVLAELLSEEKTEVHWFKICGNLFTTLSTADNDRKKRYWQLRQQKLFSWNIKSSTYRFDKQQKWWTTPEECSRMSYEIVTVFHYSLKPGWEVLGVLFLATTST